MKHHSRLHLLLLVLLLVWFPSDASVVLKVEPKEEECLILRTLGTPGDAPSIIRGDFDLLNDDISAEPLSVAILNEKMTAVYRSRPGVRSESIRVQVNAASRFYVCVQNGVPPIQEQDSIVREVGLNVKVVQMDSLTKQLEIMHEPVVKIESLLEDLTHQQSYMKMRESRHRELVEQTYTEIFYVTILEAAVLMLVASGVVFSLRRFFEKRRYM